MSPNSPVPHSTARRTAWVVLLAGAGVLTSFAFACATPFAALAALAALHLRRADAFGLVALAWLANQVIGYGFLNYPVTWDSLAWGVMIAVAACAALAAAEFADRAPVRRRGAAGALAGHLAAVAAAFAAYEAVLFGATAVLPVEDYAFSPAVVLLLLKINAVAFAGLWVLQSLGERFGLAVPALRAGLPRAA